MAAILATTSSQAADIIGTGSDDLIQYIKKENQFINHQTNEIIEVVIDEKGLRTIETTFPELINGYSGGFGEWTEVSEVPYDKAILHLEKGLRLTDGNNLHVIDTDAVVEMNFTSGTKIYGELDPDVQSDNGLITPDNTVGLTINVDAIELKILESSRGMADQMGAIATRGNGWSPSFEPNSGTYINTKQLDILSENSVYSADKTAIFIYNNLFHLNSDEINIHSTSEETRFVNGIIAANSLSEINANTINIDAETAIIVQDPLHKANGAGPSKLSITAQNITLNGAVQLYGGNLVFERDDSRASQILSITTDGTDAVTANTPDYPDHMAVNTAQLDFNISTRISSQGTSSDYANQSGKRTASALRAMRNSIFNLNQTDQKYEVYGDIIAGIGKVVTNPEVPDLPGGIVNIGGSGSILRGDILAGNTGKIELALRNGASFEGRADDYADAALSEDLVFRPAEFDIDVSDAGTINMSIDNSVWTARNRNFITKLDFVGNDPSKNIVDLSKDVNSSLTVKELSGSGTVRMNLSQQKDGEAYLSDMLYVGKLSDDAHISLDIVLNEGESYEDLNGLRFATTGGDFFSKQGATTFSARLQDQGFFNRNIAIHTEQYDTEDADNPLYNGKGNGEGGNNQASLKPGDEFVDEVFGDPQEVSTNWYFGEKIEQPDQGEDDKPDEPGQTPEDPSDDQKPSNPSTDPSDGKPQVSDAGKVLLATARGAYWSAVEIDRLTNRLGDARYANNGDDGLWIRLRKSRLGIESQEEDFQSDAVTYQIGYDHAFKRDNGHQLVGVAFDYTDWELDYNGILGEGDTDRFGVTAYTTWLADNGFYVDVVGKWGRLANDFDVYNGSGNRIKADYDNNFWAFSLEFGRKLTKPNGMFLEPNTQLQYTMVEDAQYSTSQGTEVDQDKIDSLIGRAGVRLGRAFGENQNHNIYAKADIFREFMGKQRIHVKDVTTGRNGESVAIRNKGTWFDVGAGFQSLFDENAYAYADVEYRFGNDFTQSWIVNAGVRYEF